MTIDNSLGHDHTNSAKHGIRTSFIDGCKMDTALYLDDTQNGNISNCATAYFLNLHRYDKSKLIPVNTNPTQCLTISDEFNVDVVNMDIYSYLQQLDEDGGKVGGVWLDTESWKIGKECISAFNVATSVVAITCTSAHSQFSTGDAYDGYCSRTTEYATYVTNTIKNLGVTSDWKLTSMQVYGGRGLRRSMNMVNLQFEHRRSWCSIPLYKTPCEQVSCARQSRIIVDYYVEKAYTQFCQQVEIATLREDEVVLIAGLRIGFLWGGERTPVWHVGTIISIKHSSNKQLFYADVSFSDGTFSLQLDMCLYLSTPHRIGFSWVLLEDTEVMKKSIIVDAKISSPFFTKGEIYFEMKKDDIALLPEDQRMSVRNTIRKGDVMYWSVLRSYRKKKYVVSPIFRSREGAIPKVGGVCHWTPSKEYVESRQIHV